MNEIKIDDKKCVELVYRCLPYKKQNEESLKYLEENLPLPEWNIYNHKEGKILVTPDKIFTITIFDNSIETLQSCISNTLLKKAFTSIIETST